MKKEPMPSVSAKIFLVPYGYQIDIENHLTGHGTSICRDFGGSYDTKKIAAVLETELERMMRNLEKKLE